MILIGPVLPKGGRISGWWVVVAAISAIAALGLVYALVPRPPSG